MSQSITLFSSSSSEGRCMTSPFERLLLKFMLWCAFGMGISLWAGFFRSSVTALFSTFCWRSRSFKWQSLMEFILMYERLSVLNGDFFCEFQQKSISCNSALLSVNSNFLIFFFYFEFNQRSSWWNCEEIFIVIVLKFLSSAIMNILFCHCFHNSLSNITAKSLTTGYAFDFLEQEDRTSNTLYPSL